MQHDPLTEAFARCAAQGGGTTETWHADLDHSTVLLGLPGLYDGLVLSQWSDR
ncbi:Uncharacterised protein [Mycolicibacterium aurum]|uniref:Uncharacterized protein n=1 Tax=Mycolicibacterium aurum TaxID=1791 RepID=A0A448J0T1_MYCAU|nr:hypothetical protein [Mycolicibacterium aurum]VEG58147.1 Uncharacterised protein [Mycolicibacterium aurum]